ncbi:hypothetical protein BDZ89DRAFT_1131890 [Hymenopellis radicata]|nr:hypothetical protein BDZ89DRAFT_1131890 [Hymenopellis radicata]
MLPSPAPSNDGLLAPLPVAKGHLEPHVSNLPRRRRPTQLPTPDADTDTDTIPSASSSRSSSPPLKRPLPRTRPTSPPPPSSSQSSSPFPRPTPQYHPPHHYTRANGHVQPHASNVPRRPRPIQVLPGSGIYSLPPSEASDDSGIPDPDFRYNGESRASILARALFYLCASESEWHDGLVEGVYMRLHDLGLVPLPWMGGLRREGLKVVEREIRKMILGLEEEIESC